MPPIRDPLTSRHFKFGQDEESLLISLSLWLELMMKSSRPGQEFTWTSIVSLERDEKIIPQTKLPWGWECFRRGQSLSIHRNKQGTVPLLSTSWVAETLSPGHKSLSRFFNSSNISAPVYELADFESELKLKDKESLIRFFRLSSLDIADCSRGPICQGMIHLKNLQALFNPDHHGHNVESVPVIWVVGDLETSQFLASIHKLPATVSVLLYVFYYQGSALSKGWVLRCLNLLLTSVTVTRSSWGSRRRIRSTTPPQPRDLVNSWCSACLWLWRDLDPLPVGPALESHSSWYVSSFQLFSLPNAKFLLYCRSKSSYNHLSCL